MAYILFAIGAYIIGCTVLKLDFFWNSKRAKRLRNSFGDQTASKIYYAIGAFSIIFGLLDVFNIINKN